MATQEELLQALREADKAGNTEDAQRIAGLIQKQLAAPKEAETQEGAQDGGVMGFINRGIATGLGAPVDITSSLLRAIPGMEELIPEDSFGGSKSIQGGMGLIGTETPEREPVGFVEQMAQGTGEALGFAPSISLATKALSAGKGVTGRIAQNLNREVVERPVRAAIAETAAGAGMGAGREVAEQKDLGPGATMMAEMMGGIAPGMALYTPTSLAARTLTRGTKKIGEKAFFPFTKAGGEARAARRVQELATDPDEAAKAVAAYREDPISAAASTEQQGLLELEDAVLRGDPARRQRMSERTSESVQRLRESIEGEANISNTKKFIENRKNRALAALDARVQSASDDAARALDELGDVSAEDASNLVAERLRAALDDARVEESRLWERIPQDAKVPTRLVSSKYKEWNKKLSQAQRDEMPSVAKRVIGREGATEEAGVVLFDASDRPIEIPKQIDKTTTIREMDGLYKALGEEATAARANKQFTKAKIAEELREQIIEDIGNAQGGAPIQEVIGTARAFSRELNQKFRSGPVGKILGFGREGGPQIDPSLSLEKTIGMGGQTGELGRRAIARAVQDDPTALEGVQNYIKSRFIKDAVVDGRVDPNRARSFMRKNAEMVNAFPGLKAQLTAARSSEDVTRRVTKRADFFRKALDKPAVSTTARILNGPVDEEVSRIFKSDSPQKTMRSIVQSVKKDQTGEAMKGLKSGLGQHLIREIEMPMSTDELGRSFLNGRKLKKMLNDPEVVGAIRQVYSDAEFARLKHMSDILAKFQRQRMNNREKIKVVQDAPAWLLDKVAGVAGAMFGRKIGQVAGSSTIQTPGIVSGAAKDMLRRLTSDKAEQILADAIEDKDLFEALLRYKAPKGRRDNKYDRTLRAWMAGPGARLFQEDEEGAE